jgi:hypothetical protein
MTVSISWKLNNSLDVTITEQTMPDALKTFARFGGDGGWLTEQIKAVTPILQEDPAAPVINEQTPAQVSGDDDWLPSDVKVEDDPWGADPAEEDPFSEPSQSSAKPSPAAASTSAPHVTLDKFGREFTIGLPNAPSCTGHSEPAVKMKAKKKDGSGTYSKWLCARSAGSQYKSKCDFSEWI